MYPSPWQYTHPSCSLCQPRNGDEACTWALGLLSRRTPQWSLGLCSCGSEQRKTWVVLVPHNRFGLWVSHTGRTTCLFANYAELNCTAKVTLPHLFVCVCFYSITVLVPVSSMEDKTKFLCHFTTSLILWLTVVNRKITKSNLKTADFNTQQYTKSTSYQSTS